MLFWMKSKNKAGAGLKMNKCVYVIKDPIIHEIRYVGVTKDFNKRTRQHVVQMNYKGRRHLPLYCWMRSLGVVPLFEPFFDASVLSDTQLSESEIYWIKYFRDLGCRLLNCTDGGGLFNPNAEVRKKISDAKKELYKDPTKNPMFGRPNPRRKLLSKHTRKMQELQTFRSES